MINPEFRRNIWLELTFSRLILIPLLLGLIFFIAYMIDRQGTGLYESIRSSARILFFLFAFIWGTKAASEALSDEINEQTWDFQRMSPFGAWSMTWGKILGASSHAWYGALICLTVMAIADLQIYPAYIVIRFLYLLICSALLCQCVAFQLSLHSILKTRSYRRGSIIGFLIFALPIGILFSRYGLSIEPYMSSSSTSTAYIVQWYGMNFNMAWFVCTSLLVFLVWSFYGAYRLMRMELQYQSLPTAWLSFLIFISVYLGGFVPDIIKELSLERITSTFFIAFFTSMTFLYLLIFTEPKSSVTFRKIMQAWRNGNLRRIGTLLPCWLVTAIFLIFVSIALIIIAPEVSLNKWQVPLRSFFVSALLFALRDILIVLILNILPFTARRADQAAFIILIILYLLLPSTLLAIGLKDIGVFFYPFNDSTNFIKVIGSPLLQVSVLLVLFFKKWRQNMQLVESS